MILVVDASLLVALLVDSGPEGRWAESLLSDVELAAPELVMAETMNVLRRLERAAVITAMEANLAVRDLRRLDIQLFPFAPIGERIWQLRANLTSYDAWYVALAEAIGCEVATLDRRLASAGGARCGFRTPPD